MSGRGGHAVQCYGGPIDGHVMVVDELMSFWHVPMQPAQFLDESQPLETYTEARFLTAEYVLVLSGPGGIPMFNGAGEAKYEYRGML